jgi:aspartyl-tRNA synthetase
MSGGIERYFQFAKCMRDEDTRGDRQPEFTQLDIEMSFVNEEDVRKINEDILIKMIKELFPEKKIQQIPFPILTYKEAMEKYGNDRPDLREDKNDPNLLAFCWVIDFPFFEKTEEGGWTFTHNPFSRPKPEHMEWLMNKENIEEILTTQYDVALNGMEIGGGSIRNHDPKALEKVFEVMGHKTDDIHKNFGHMMNAFSLGTPPHGGIAWGLDRFVMTMQNEPNRRNVVIQKAIGNKSRLGDHKTIEERKKISESLTGRKRSQESIEKQRQSLIGRKQTPESIAKRVKSNTGKKRQGNALINMQEMAKKMREIKKQKRIEE